MSRVGHLLVAAVLVAAYFAGIPRHAGEPRPPFRVPPAVEAVPDPGDEWRRGFASDGRTRLVHAPSLVELADGRVRAFWFAGSREGASDVGIHSAVFDPATGRWSDERRVLGRLEVARGLNRHVRKLGNMVAVRRGNRLQLYVVAVSFGGWSGSRLAVAESRDQGRSWTVREGLVTSPFLNLSTLVKNPPVRYRDGSLGLPVYHELVGKFGQLLRLGEQGRVLSQDNIGKGRASLQPMVFVHGPDRARAFLRNGDPDRPGILFSSHTADRGKTWSPLADSGLPNPGSATSGVSLGPQHWLLALNNNPEERDDLMIVETRDGGEHWQHLAVLHDRRAQRGRALAPERFASALRERLLPLAGAPPADEIVAGVRETKCSKAGCTFQFDYPYMLRTDSGDIHVVYTWNKTMIGHAWWPAEPTGGDS